MQIFIRQRQLSHPNKKSLAQSLSYLCNSHKYVLVVKLQKTIERSLQLKLYTLKLQSLRQKASELAVCVTVWSCYFCRR